MLFRSNTATAHSLCKLQKLFHIPIIGVIAPGVAAAVAQSKNQHIGVIGTKGTIQSGIYQKALQEKAPTAQIIAAACPLFTPLVEEQYCESPFAKAIIAEHLRVFKSHCIDTLLLGCTHYPLLKHLIAEEIGPGVAIVDSASTCAENVASLLNNYPSNYSAFECSNIPLCSLQKVSFFVSDDPERFRNIGEKFLEMPIPKVFKVSIPS